MRLDEGFLWVASGRDGHRTKSEKERWVPLTSRLRRALQEHAARFHLQSYHGEQSPWVFHLTRGPRKGHRAREYRTVIETAAERVKLPEQWLRHRRVTTWLAQGKNSVHVKEAMGHSTIQVTMGYPHLAREHFL